MNRLLKPLIPLSVLMLLIACAEAPKPAEQKAKEPPKPPEAVTALKAFWQMYGAARGWATDLETLQMSSIALPEIPAKDGKYPAWQATFVSPSKRSSRTFTYAVIESQGLFKGVFARHEDTYSGPHGQVSPFPIAALKVDSDAALAAAVKKSAQYMKKFPDKPVTFLLERTKRFPNPAWRVIWGESVSSSDYSVYVDASTGEYLQTMR